MSEDEAEILNDNELDESDIDDIGSDSELLRKTNSDDEDEDSLFDSDDESDDDYPLNEVKNNNQHSYAKYYVKIPDDERMTTNVMSLYEYTAIISLRAKQISNGMSKMPNTFIDPSEIIKNNSQNIEELIAIKELKEGKCPMKIRRFIDDTHYEIWSANELVFTQ